jgi:hypothetical protein
MNFFIYVLYCFIPYLNIVSGDLLENQNPTINTLYVLGNSTFKGPVTMSNGCNIDSQGITVQGPIIFPDIKAPVGNNFLIIDSNGLVTSSSDGSSSATFGILKVTDQSTLRGNTVMTGIVHINSSTPGDITIGNSVSGNKVIIAGNDLLLDVPNLQPNSGSSFLLLNSDKTISSTNVVPTVFNTITVSGQADLQGLTNIQGNLSINGSNLSITNLSQTPTNKYLVVDDHGKVGVASGGSESTTFDSIVVNGDATLNGRVTISGDFECNKGIIQNHAVTIGNTTAGGEINLATSKSITLSAKQLQVNINGLSPVGGSSNLLTIDNSGLVSSISNPFSVDPHYSSLKVSGKSSLNSVDVSGGVTINTIGNGTTTIGNENSKTTIDGTKLYITGLDTSKRFLGLLDSSGKIGTLDAGAAGGNFETIAVSQSSVLNGTTTINGVIFLDGTQLKITNLSPTIINKYLVLDEQGKVGLASGGDQVTEFDTITVNGLSKLQGGVDIDAVVAINTKKSSNYPIIMGNSTLGGSITLATNNIITLQGKNIIFQVPSLIPATGTNLLTIDNLGLIGKIPNPFSDTLTFPKITITGNTTCEGNAIVNGNFTVHGSSTIGNASSRTTIDGTNLFIPSLPGTGTYLIIDNGQIKKSTGGSTDSHFNEITVSQNTNLSGTTNISGNITLDGSNLTITTLDTTGGKKYLTLGANGKVETSAGGSANAGKGEFSELIVSGNSLLKGNVSIGTAGQSNKLTISSLSTFNQLVDIKNNVTISGNLTVNQLGSYGVSIGNSTNGGNVSIAAHSTKNNISLTAANLLCDVKNILIPSDSKKKYLLTINNSKLVESVDPLSFFPSGTLTNITVNGSTLLNAIDNNNVIKLLGNSRPGCIVINATGNPQAYSGSAQVVITGNVGINDDGVYATSLQGQSILIQASDVSLYSNNSFLISAEKQLTIGDMLNTTNINLNSKNSIYIGSSNNQGEATKAIYMRGNNVYLGTGSLPQFNLDTVATGTSAITLTDQGKIYFKFTTVEVNPPYILGVKIARPLGIDTDMYQLVLIPNGSSRIFKENIVVLDDKEDEISKLQPIQFTYKKYNGEKNPIHYGYLIEDMIENNIFTELISYDEQNNPVSVDYQSIFVAATQVLVKKMNELHHLENTVLELEKEMKTISDYDFNELKDAYIELIKLLQVKNN